MAALQGHDLDKPNDEEPKETLADIMARIEEEQGLTSGESREAREFAGMNIMVEEVE